MRHQSPHGSSNAAIVVIVLTLLLGTAAAASPATAAVPNADQRSTAAVVTSTVGTVAAFGLAGIFNPTSVAHGPDGNLWFTNLSNNSIGRMTGTGAVVSFTDSMIDRPGSIVAGPDGAMWFTNGGLDEPTIGRITAAGLISHIPLPGSDLVNALTVGADGNLWFAYDAKTIARMTTDGELTLFEGSMSLAIQGMTAGPDGNIWVTNTVAAEEWRGWITRVTLDGEIETFTHPDVAFPVEISPGPDGNVWFTDLESAAIGRITPAGVISLFSAAAGVIERPRGIRSATDGALWFTSSGTNAIGRVTTEGAFTTFTDPSIGLPLALSQGPNGNLWFSNAANDSIGEIALDGTISNHIELVDGAPAPLMKSPEGIVLGPDGDLWFANRARNAIGRITTTGVISNYVDPSIKAPRNLVSGPDGLIWFTINGAAAGIGRITVEGEVETFVDPSIKNPAGLATGPDGNLWFTNQQPGSPTIGRITPTGVVSTFPLPDTGFLGEVVGGPDGNVWYSSATAIGRVTPEGEVAVFTDPELRGGNGIALGPDGNLWFTGASATKSLIGRITILGAVTIFKDPTIKSPVDITAAVDGALWFTNRGHLASVGRITVDGVVSSLTNPSINHPTSITSGPAGTVWFTNDGTSSIGRITIAEAAEPGSYFHPVPPSRLADSRVSWPGDEVGPVHRDDPKPLVISDASAFVPVSATAVVLNITVTEPSHDGFLTVHPAGTPRPDTSNVNFAQGQTRANLVTVAMTHGEIAFAVSAGSADVVVDVAGYFAQSDGSRFSAVAPARILDSRGATGGWDGPLAADGPRSLLLDGHVPSAADSVMLNVTVTDSTANSFLSVTPSGVGATVSNLNFGAGETIANMVAVSIGADRRIDVRTEVGSVHVVVDLAGYFDPSTGDLFHPLTPVRVLDSRGPIGGWHEALSAAEPRVVSAAGAAPATASSVVGNVTVTEPSADSFLSVYPSDVTNPGSSNLNFGAGSTVANHLVVKLGEDAGLGVANAVGATHVVLDLAGYFAPTSNDVGARTTMHPITRRHSIPPFRQRGVANLVPCVPGASSLWHPTRSTPATFQHQPPSVLRQK